MQLLLHVLYADVTMVRAWATPEPLGRLYRYEAPSFMGFCSRLLGLVVPSLALLVEIYWTVELIATKLVANQFSCLLHQLVACLAPWFGSDVVEHRRIACMMLNNCHTRQL